MKRQHIIDELREALGGTATSGAAALALDSVLLALEEGLREDGVVKLSGFGSFRVQESPARRLRHPKTGELCTIPAQRKIKFRPSPQQQSCLP